jgi:hypothetical protein
MNPVTMQYPDSMPEFWTTADRGTGSQYLSEHPVQSLPVLLPFA